MYIRDKEQGVNKLKDLNLNRMPGDVFDKSNEKAIRKFVADNPWHEYLLRDVSQPNGKFSFAKNIDEILQKAAAYKDIFYLGHSTNNMARTLLVGDIFIGQDMNLMLTASSRTSSHREMAKKPEFDFNTTVYDPALKRIPYFDTVLNYVFRYKLFDMVVEFAIFDTPVGVNQQKLVIYELRSQY